MTIDVTAVNDAPTAANPTVTTNEDTDYTFSAAEFSYADTDNDPLSSVKITGLPTAGTLKLDGTTIASGVLPKTVAAADLAAGKLTYTPPRQRERAGLRELHVQGQRRDGGQRPIHHHDQRHRL